MRSTSGRTGTYTTPGPWSQVYAVDALCPDGKVRKVRVGTPDTFFSVPGRTRIAGVNVAGFVSVADNFKWVPSDSPEAKRYGGKLLVDNPDAGEWVFTPYKYAKNYAKLADKLGLEK